MIPSITLLLVLVALTGCCFAQTVKVSDEDCRIGRAVHTNFGSCLIHKVRQIPGPICEFEVECDTKKIGVCPKRTETFELFKWEVDYVDAPNNYVCVYRQLQKPHVCLTYVACFQDRFVGKTCVYAMKVNHYQRSTENLVHFKMIEIKIYNAVGRNEVMCSDLPSILALTTSDGNKAFVISHCNHWEINWTDNFTDPTKLNALVSRLNGFCPIEEPSSKECIWSSWTDVSGCERRFNNPTLTCNKTRVRHQISQDRDAPSRSCNATEVQSIECTNQDVVTGCDLGDDNLPARCHDWMIGFCSVTVALLLVGVLAIVLILERWKPTSPRHVAVPAGGEGLMAEITGREVVDGTNEQLTAM